MSLINNQGDIGAVLKELGSSDTIKSLATSMLTAGLSAGIDQAVFASMGGNSAGGLTGSSALAGRLSQLPTRLARNVLSSAIRSSIAAAIQGGNVGDLLLNSLRGVAVDEVLAATQAAIGDFTDGLGARDLPVANLLAHAVAGGLAAEAMGNDFAAGAASALASTFAAQAGLYKQLNRQQINALSQVLGAAAALMVGGDGAEVNQGAGIASSAAINNYLTHAEIKAFEREIAECKRDVRCKIEVQEKFRRLSLLHSQELKACGTDNACITRHLMQMAEAASAMQNFFREGGLHPLLIKSFQLQQLADFRHAVSTYAENRLLSQACPTLSEGCVRRERAKWAARGLTELAVDFTPVLGDMKAFAEALESGQLSDWIAAAIGVVPLVGDGVSKALRRAGRNAIRVEGDIIGIDDTVFGKTISIGRDSHGQFLLRAEDGRYLILESSGDLRLLGRDEIFDLLPNSFKDLRNTSWVQDGRLTWINPLTGKTEIMPFEEILKGNMTVDHILPKDKIRKTPGFDDLPASVQQSLLRDPRNLMPLTRSANSSKGCRVEYCGPGWVQWRGQWVSKEFKDMLYVKQTEFQRYVESVIEQHGIRTGGP